MYSKRENNSLIYKNDKVYIRLILIPVLLSTAVFFCLVIVVHESFVCPEQLNCLLFFGKILQLPRIIWFSSIFVYLNPFQQLMYDFEIHLFTPRTTEGLICNYYRRFKHSLMLQKEKLCIESQGENYYFHLVDNMQTLKYLIQVSTK